MAMGMALSVTGAPSGFLEMMNLQVMPASLTIWSPTNSASLLAVEMEVDFWLSSCERALDMDLFSEINLKSSVLGLLASVTSFSLFLHRPL